MSSFTSNILLEQLGKTENCEVKRRFSFYSDRFGLRVTIKKGFITDLASIPQILTGIVRASSPIYFRAFCLHDALYRKGLPLKEADIMLDEALNILGMGAYARAKIYYGLRMFGSPTTDEALIQNATKNVILDYYELIK
jgi:hypothetical protein